MAEGKGLPMNALDDVVELRAVYGFTDPIVIDLETVDSEWLDGHCDVVGFARNVSEIPRGLWLEQGYILEVAETRLVSQRDERAVRTRSGPIVFCFTHAEPLTRRGSMDTLSLPTGRHPAAYPPTPMSEYRVSAESDIYMAFARDAPFTPLGAPAHQDATNEPHSPRLPHAGEQGECLSAQWTAPA
jgi:hypothetical protein